MKKVTLIAVVSLLAVLLSGLAVAAQAQVPAQNAGIGSCPYYGQYNNNLTDEQKAEIAAWRQQNLEHKKQVLAKKVEWGWITQAQAGQQISRMEQRMASGAYGQGMMGQGMRGRCARGAGNW